jgi:hypothetical protein
MNRDRGDAPVTLDLSRAGSLAAICSSILHGSSMPPQTTTSSMGDKVTLCECGVLSSGLVGQELQPAASEG